ncbi:MAG: sigma-70 family RNA polymerase sigma factor [Dehalococcoidia bacterium]|nr:sigma-70 family RNA polymerase sigma factor [Dehalococcoidia bacterium]
MGELLNYAEASDADLMAGMRERDVRAFETLFQRYSDLVFSTCLRVLADPALAEDMVQEIFIRVWRRPEAFDAERGKFVTWLLSVSRNRAVDEIRSRGRRRRHELGNVIAVEETPSGRESENPLASAELASEREAILEALSTLPAEQRTAIELAYFKGLTQQEIATSLKQPLGTIKTRVRLGMQKLRQFMHQREERGRATS